jgi:hypothetical protein
VVAGARLSRIARAVFGVIVGLAAGTVLAYMTTNAAWSQRSMFVTQGVILAVAAAIGIRRTLLRRFGFVEGALFGIVAAIIVCWILLILIVGANP